ncbi:unnamed protein product [Rangifer tarandus platyrhynchus]|uniref:Uncharacterized protein n=1 Tax=Rangifer tarandus platyrhynchus TaxID=3082113 RepID=A0AC59ZYL9_RANTA
MTSQPWQVSPGLRGEGLRNNCSSTHGWGTGPRGSGTSSKDLYVVDTVSSPSKMEHDPSFLCVQLACSVQSVQTSYPSPVFHGNPFDPQGQRPCCWVGWRQALCGPLGGPLPQPFLMATVHAQLRSCSCDPHLRLCPQPWAHNIHTCSGSHCVSTSSPCTLCHWGSGGRSAEVSGNALGSRRALLCLRPPPRLLDSPDKLLCLECDIPGASGPSLARNHLEDK